MNLFGGVIAISGLTFFLFCVFLVAAAGYVIGRITVRGLSLGTAGVFIAALLFGCFFYGRLEDQLGIMTKDALRLVENIGLVLFVTSVGFIAGPKFFGNLRANFRSYAALGALIIGCGGAAALLCLLIGRAAGEPDPRKLTAMVAGLFSGALTSTPAFSAAKASVDAAYEDIVSVGYGIAYIYGVIGVVLFVQIIPALLRADMKEELKKIDPVAPGYEKLRADDRKLLHMDPFGVMPFAAAVVIGITVGTIRIPLSRAGLSGTTFSLTTTGGCLLSALVIGHFGRAGRVSLMPFQSSLKVFREFGLCLFLTGAGIGGGARFVENFQVIYFFYGMIMTTASMVCGYLAASRVLKLSLLNSLSAVTGGMTSTPALGTLIAVAGSEDVAAAYAATYPVALICVVLVSQLLILFF